ncbi:hypothetical protein UFOVP916_57 [uncultured Caudovirales phage]|uniref:Terminase small subunit n=1 Tax=uncultured Caudovirales phage TaxID=2100421 RepID=A0A6J5Q7I8_9CAUD|nr:hypothetical protein UFOVP827_12 [uncultured Caudovirales phage]CAB4171486.1 hypothetical protein UFOVP916_57 [uncultured Caudovirales phage]CAB4177305.1 hypothetical protein UFOVP1001_15 [uncultured Caudovirales phage]CAB4199562.1 hypothetical protein UFOVP1338_61 [uncultured Caudovirales phage]CAB4213551.1 hypothetical protein UFOVP1447_56 [uncultured Caudovirales phage]
MAKTKSKAHIEFIRLVASGVTQTEAYRVTCGNKSVTTNVAKVKGSQLAKRYAQEITEAKEKDRKAVEGVKDLKVVQEALNGILSQSEVDKKLCDIINGNFLIEDVAIYMGCEVPYKRKPNANEVAKAIDLYNKRFGSYAPTKTDLTSKGESINKPTIIDWSDKDNPDTEAKGG